MTKSLEELDIVLTRHGGKTTASMAELRLFATADSDSGALFALEEKRRAMLADLEAAGLLGEFEAQLEDRRASSRKRMFAWTRGTENSGTSRSASSLGESALRTFVNTLVIVAVIASGLVIGGSVLVNRAEEAVTRAKLIVGSQKVGGAAFWANLETKLHNNAAPENDLPEAKKQQLLADLHVLVDRVRPFIHEAMQVFADPVSPPKSSAAPSK